jgi:hypothetical protein
VTEKTCWESFKVEGSDIIEKLKALVHEGNVRRIVVEQRGRTIAEFPLTVGVVGAVLAPVLAAVGALVAVMTECTIQVERVDTGTGPQPAPPPETASEPSA